MIPESRKDDGLILRRPVRENVSLPSLRRFQPARDSCDAAPERTRSARRSNRSTARRCSRRRPASLSGGNQQKLLFARAMLIAPGVLIADEPTRGVDVGAKRDIYEVLVRLAADGMAVLLISNEIEEILGLAHRVLVMRAGRLVAELAGTEMTEEAIVERGVRHGQEDRRMTARRRPRRSAPAPTSAARGPPGRPGGIVIPF